MINAITIGISRELGKEFGKSYKVHKESIEQGLKEPCFFINCLNPTTKLFRGTKYFRTNQFCIQYFPESKKEINTECNEVAECLTWCLEYITADGDAMRGTNMHHEIVDGVLNFFVNYDCFVYRIGEQEEKMQRLIQKQGLKR